MPPSLNRHAHGQCQETRSLTRNRHIARRILEGRLDVALNGSLSKAAKQEAKIQRRKSKARQRQRTKYGKDAALAATDDDDDDDGHDDNTDTKVDDDPRIPERSHER